jgi:hypothetical protein
MATLPCYPTASLGASLFSIRESLLLWVGNLVCSLITDPRSASSYEKHQVGILPEGERDTW